MQYVIKEKEFKKGFYTFTEDLDGLEIKPKTGKEYEGITLKKVVICDEELATKYVKKIIDKKIENILKIMCKVLNEDDSTDDAVAVLDQVAKYKSVIINKYKNYITNKYYKDVMKKFILMEEEFKNKYMYKEICNYYEEELNIGRKK